MSLKDTAPRFGLPPCLWIPIAAVSLDALEAFVGRIIEQRTYGGIVNAVLLEPHRIIIDKDPRVQLWRTPRAAEYEARLHPPRQVWVDVDYRGYRKAYLDFGLPPIIPGYVLDHIQNRKAIRARGYTHRLLRLCPVAVSVNTSGGHKMGGEGMERDYVAAVAALPPEQQAPFKTAISHPIVYADPMDLTKMLDVSPGTQTLPDVRDTQALFYPAGR